VTAVSFQAKMCVICRVSDHTYPRSSSPWAIEFGFAFDESRESLARSPTYGTHFRLPRHGRHDSDLKHYIWVRREHSYCVIPELDDPTTPKPTNKRRVRPTTTRSTTSPSRHFVDWDSGIRLDEPGSITWLPSVLHEPPVAGAADPDLP